MFRHILLALFLFSSVVAAHPGRTATDGCHYCRTNCDKWGEVAGQRHCHSAPKASPVASTGKEFTGTVVKVVDGDTVHLINQSGTKLKIRLMGIDAPEMKQKGGKASRDYLASLVDGKNAVADCSTKDKYQRWVCKILVNGQDMNLKMVQDGHAWHYKQYQSEQSASDRNSYSKAEEAAASRREGLWHGDPMPPWEFRKSKK